MFKNIFYLSLVVLFTSCNSLWVKTVHYTGTKGEVLIGNIGKTQVKGFQKVFSSQGVPSFSEGILLSAEKQKFSKFSYNKYVNACKIQGKQVNASYIDSIKNNSDYIHLKVADEIKVTEQLYSEKNKEVLTHIQNFPEDRIVSELLIYFPEDQTKALFQAEEVFLINNNYKSYQLALYSKGKHTQTLSFTDGVVFAYQLSGFCWYKTNKGEYKISGLKSTKDVCPFGQFDSKIKAVKNEKKDIF